MVRTRHQIKVDEARAMWTEDHDVMMKLLQSFDHHNTWMYVTSSVSNCKYPTYPCSCKKTRAFMIPFLQDAYTRKKEQMNETDQRCKESLENHDRDCYWGLYECRCQTLGKKYSYLCDFVKVLDSLLHPDPTFAFLWDLSFPK